jgi:hypothetical protein
MRHTGSAIERVSDTTMRADQQATLNVTME